LIVTVKYKEVRSREEGRRREEGSRREQGREERHPREQRHSCEKGRRHWPERKKPLRFKDAVTIS
jgi:hypothetical protein